MQNEKVPDWAIDLACERAGVFRVDFNQWNASNLASQVVTKYARYIAKHEEPPVDRFLEGVTEALVNTYALVAEADVQKLASELRKRGFARKEDSHAG